MAQIPIASFKRDQVERAIGKTTGRIAKAAGDPDAKLKADLKRLLDFDRTYKQIEPERRRYAFLDAPPPGRRGIDILYSREAAFALLIGERLLQGGLTQGRAIHLVRVLRDALDQELRRILATPITTLAPDIIEPEREPRISYGSLVRNSDQMTFLVTPSGHGASVYHRRTPEGGFEVANLCRGEAALVELMTFFGRSGTVIFTLELTNLALQLSYWLDRVPTRKRGRS